MANAQAPAPGTDYMESFEAAKAHLKLPIGPRFLLSFLKAQQLQLLMFEDFTEWVRIYTVSSLKAVGFDTENFSSPEGDGSKEHSAVMGELEACGPQGLSPSCAWLSSGHCLGQQRH